MIILPAIDIKNGMCVRLFKGDFNTVHKVADDIYATASDFVNKGAQMLHIVDLDGAKDGKPVNRELIIDVMKKSGAKIEIGGGIRDLKAIEEYIKEGVDRVILGSVALKNPSLVRQAVRQFGGHIAVGIDAMNEFAAVEGWVESSNIHFIELAKRMEDSGVTNIIYTDINRDGMLSGANYEHYERLKAAVNVDITASGGIKNIDDIKRLAEIGVYGAICGKSIYEGTLDLEEAIKCGTQNIRS
jgi:phosphoribosylformimino-5-aminoimidazole carboxamide ribotide isomerase